MDHLCACIGLHLSICQGHGIKFSDRIVALQNAARIFPSDGSAYLNLRPGNFGIDPCTASSFGHKIKNSPFACFGIARIPVLHGRIFNFGIIQVRSAQQQPHGADCYHRQALCILPDS